MMRHIAFLLLAASVLQAQKAEILKLTDELEAAMRTDDWRRATELSRALNATVKQARDDSMAREGRELADSILAWLPTDTETFVVAAQPFTLNVRDARKVPTALASAQGFVVMLLAGSESQALLRGLAGRTVRLAAVAGRRFGEQPQEASPLGTHTPLGMIPYQGCGAYAFTQPVESLLKRPPDDTILGHRVWISKGALNDRPGSTTFLLSFLKPDLILACNNREFFTEMVTRMAAPSDSRALPAGLEEWKLIDRTAPLWGISHYRKDAERLRMFLPALRESAATGVAVEFGLDGGATRARMICPSDPWKLALRSPDMRNSARSSQVSNGVWELAVDGKPEAASLVALVLMGIMGFVVLI